MIIIIYIHGSNAPAAKTDKQGHIDWQAVKPATWTLAHGAAMYALGGDCRVGKDESKRRCYRIKYLAEANRNRHAGIDTSGYDYL